MVTGGRQSADIVNWLKKKTGPPAANLDNVDDAKKFVDKDEVVLIGFFKVRLHCHSDSVMRQK